MTSVKEIMSKTQEYQESLMQKLVDRLVDAQLNEHKELIAKANDAHQLLQKTQREYQVTHQVEMNRDELQRLQAFVAQEKNKLQTITKRIQDDLELASSSALAKALKRLEKIRSLANEFIGQGNDAHYSELIQIEVDNVVQLLTKTS